MMKEHRYIISLVALAMIIAISLGSCTKDSGPIIIRPNTDTVSFKDTILPMFLAKCVNCHPGNASLNLNTSFAYQELVNVASINYPPFLRVSPEDPENSVLYQKLTGNSEFGPIMPLYTAPYTDEEIGLVYDWIAQGALDN